MNKEAKACPRCKIVKPMADFYSDKSHADGRSSSCGACTRAAYKPRHVTPREQAYNRAKYLAARDERIRYAAEYRQKNREKVAAAVRRSEAKRLANDPQYKMAHSVRNRIRGALKLAGVRKSRRSIDFLGCSFTELRQWLESRFQAGMTMENHGKVWDVDHVIPVSAWDLSDPEQSKAAFHWTNLQPMFKAENRWQKGGAVRYPSGFFDAVKAERLLVLRAMEVI